ncbi:MAG: hypothetical protein Sv326_0692 [Candidatus Fermentimicrarchaeum limneticum]|uniref:MCM C-terminal AAA(+) ATPase domain-containing protein n=1 Tax=Fermentimicrarchaeum limneticum TaxID=2795018 RepID=A0A7D5XPT4_FERL1|nr:MAG: hypothetical protein Sv326_0692 [Candidatus Fermentimicrarchaeum limneticum]
MSAISIPKQLQNSAFRFAKIKKGQKGPFETAWNTTQNYQYTDKKITSWEGNIGLVAGYDAVIGIDCDKPEVAMAIGEKLPRTFSLLTGSGHENFVFRCKGACNIKEVSNVYGEVFSVRAKEEVLVIPPSIHPNGKPYSVKNDVEIAEVAWSLIVEILSPFMTKAIEEVAEEETRVISSSRLSFTCADIVNLRKLRNMGDGVFQGAHPFHGSTSTPPMNFKIDTKKDVWYCFRHMVGAGAMQLLALREGILTCGECGRGALDKQKYDQVKKRAMELGLAAKREKEPSEIRHDVPKLPVSDLSADYIGCEVCVEVRVVGGKFQMAIPYEIYTDAERKNTRKLDAKAAIFFSNFPDDMVASQHNYSVIYVQNLLEQIPKYEKKFYTPTRIHAVGRVPPSAKKIKIWGEVIVEPKTKEISIIAEKIQPLETEFSDFKINEGDRINFPKYFSSGIDLSSQISPDLVGRPLVKESRLLVLHSPSKIPDIMGNAIRGSLVEVYIGDTKCFKSKSMEDTTTSHYHLGDYIVAESASRAGITYTIDTDNHTIVWGALPMNDLGYVAIDGLQNIHSDEIGEFREALEQQRVIVRRSQAGEALSRVRITAALNPNKSKPINNYLYRCMAWLDTYIFVEPANLTRWDAFHVFGDADVDKDLIASRKAGTRPIPDDIFLRHVYWVWSRKPEHITYTNEAANEIIEKAKMIMREYSIPSLPIVHNGFRDVLTRFSVAYACLLHSTDSTQEQVIVDKVHVDRAVEFYTKMLEDLQLKDFKLSEEGKLEITENEFTEICKSLDSTDYKILDSIKITAKTSTALSQELDVSTATIKRSYGTLGDFGLIKATTGKGAELTARGVIFLHKLKKGGGVAVPSVIVSKNDTIPSYVEPETTKDSIKPTGGSNDTSVILSPPNLILSQNALRREEASKNDTNFLQKKENSDVLVSQSDTMHPQPAGGGWVLGSKSHVPSSRVLMGRPMAHSNRVTLQSCHRRKQSCLLNGG